MVVPPAVAGLAAMVTLYKFAVAWCDGVGNPEREAAKIQKMLDAANAEYAGLPDKRKKDAKALKACMDQLEKDIKAKKWQAIGGGFTAIKEFHLG
jgi:hypothetical protein